jgi:hypothetical protein
MTQRGGSVSAASVGANELLDTRHGSADGGHGGQLGGDPRGGITHAAVAESARGVVGDGVGGEPVGGDDDAGAGALDGPAFSN